MWYYFVAALCGIGTGWADVAINDLLFTALLVVFSCMMLGLLTAAGALAVGDHCGDVDSDLGVCGVSVLLTVKPTRDQVYGSILDFLPGIAGAYGGSFMRRVVENLRDKKQGFGPWALGFRLFGLPALGTTRKELTTEEHVRATESRVLGFRTWELEFLGAVGRPLLLGIG